MLNGSQAAWIQGPPPGTRRPRPDEMVTAMRVQSRLLPQVFPALPTLRCHALSQAARGIGGDFYDFIEPRAGRLDLVLGDVSGKGVPAALVMASLQALLRSHAALVTGDLARQLASVNGLFVECTEPNHYTTLFFGQYDEATRRLRYANCGHLPPLLHRPGSGVSRLEPTATVLGMFSEWNCDVNEVAFEPGDTLLLYTDGVTEARNRFGEDFGEARLEAAVRAYAALALPDMLDALLVEVRSFTEGRFLDDLTLVAARAFRPAEGGTEAGEEA